MKNYYKILNIKQTATESEIRRSYLVLAKKYHPDLNPNDKMAAERFANVNEAYGVLSDINKKAEYDKTLSATIVANSSQSQANAKAQTQTQSAYNHNMQNAQSTQTVRGVHNTQSVQAAQIAAEARARVQSALNANRANSNPYTYARRVAQEAIEQEQIVRANAVAAARMYKYQLAATEKRARNAGIAEGKRTVQKVIAAAVQELNSLRAENARLSSKLEGLEKERGELTQTLDEREREYNQEKKRASELDKQYQTIKLHTVDRSEFAAVSAELVAARAANVTLARRVANAERAAVENEKKIAETAELAKKFAQSERARIECEKKLAESNEIARKFVQSERARLAAKRRAKAERDADELRTAELERQLVELRDRTVERSAYNSLKAVGNKLVSENSALKSRIAELEDEQSKTPKVSPTLLKKAQNAERYAAELDKSKSEIARLNEKAQKMAKERAELLNKLRRTKKALVEREKLTETDENGDDEILTAEYEKFATELENSRAEIAELSEKSQALENERAELMEKMHQAQLKYQSELEEQKRRAEDAERLAENARTATDGGISEEVQRQIDELSDVKNVLAIRLENMNAELQQQRMRADEAERKANEAMSGASGGVSEEVQRQIDELSVVKAELAQRLQLMNVELEEQKRRAELAESRLQHVQSENEKSDEAFDIIDELQAERNSLLEKLQSLNEELEAERLRAEKAERLTATFDNEKELLIENFKEIHSDAVVEAAERIEQEQERTRELEEKLERLNDNLVAEREHSQEHTRDLEEQLERLNADLEAEREHVQEVADGIAHDEEIKVMVANLSFNAEAGDVESQNRLGEMYLYGNGVQKNYELAAYWFKEATKQKYPDAMYNLGICFINGAGVEKNVRAGNSFIKQAAKLGSQRAKKYKKGRNSIV